MATFIFIDNERIRPAADTRIIKAADYAVVGPAAQLLDQARRHAETMSEDAKAAFRAEKQRGFKEGMRQARQEMSEQMATMALRTEQHYRDLEAQTVGLVRAIVGKVLQDIDPSDLIVAQTKKALSVFKGRRHLTIKAHPAVSHLLEQRFSELVPDATALDTLEIKSVPQLSREELILESETGIVEASLKTQLAAIEDAIRKELQLPN